MGKKGKYYVMVKWKDRATAVKMYVTSTEPANMERFLEKHLWRWENAHLAEKSTKTIVHYYHPSRYNRSAGTHRLTKDEYINAGTKKYYQLCIIPTTERKRRTGNYKPLGARVNDLDDIPNYWNSDVLRIDVYCYQEKIASYDERGCRMLTKQAV